MSDETLLEESTQDPTEPITARLARLRAARQAASAGQSQSGEEPILARLARLRNERPIRMAPVVVSTPESPVASATAVADAVRQPRAAFDAAVAPVVVSTPEPSPIALAPAPTPVMAPHPDVLAAAAAPPLIRQAPAPGRFQPPAASADVTAAPVPGVVEQPDPFAPKPNVLERAVGAGAEMATHPVQTAVGFVKAPLDAAFTLGQFAGERAHGVEHPHVSAHDAEVAATQLGAMAAAGPAEGLLEGGLARTGVAGLIGSRAAGMIAPAAVGAGVGAAFSPGDRGVGALLGGAAGAAGAGAMDTRLPVRRAITEPLGVERQLPPPEDTRTAPPPQVARVVAPEPAPTGPDFTVEDLPAQQPAAAPTAPKAPPPPPVVEQVPPTEAIANAKQYIEDVKAAQGIPTPEPAEPAVPAAGRGPAEVQRDLPDHLKTPEELTAEGKNPTLSQLEQLPTSPYDTPEIVAARSQFRPQSPTSLINTPERQAMRDAIVRADYGTGAARKEKEVTYVLGLPGAGKSTLVAPYAETHGALVTDADRIKAQLPEYANGAGAPVVHRESVDLRDRVVQQAAANGDNLVIQTMGLSAPNLTQQIADWHAAGWKVHVKLVDVPKEVAAQRAAIRYMQGGHFVDPADILNHGDAPRQTFDAVKHLTGVTSYARYDANVPRHEPFRLAESGAPAPAGAAEQPAVGGAGAGAGTPDGGGDLRGAPPVGAAPVAGTEASGAVTQEVPRDTGPLRTGVPDESQGEPPGPVPIVERLADIRRARAGGGRPGVGAVRGPAGAAPPTAPGAAGSAVPLPSATPGRAPAAGGGAGHAGSAGAGRGDGVGGAARGLPRPGEPAVGGTGRPEPVAGRGAGILGGFGGKAFLNKNPTGTYSFVGGVHPFLAFTNREGGLPTKEQVAAARHAGSHIAGLKERSWPTPEAALAAADEVGQQVQNRAEYEAPSAVRERGARSDDAPADIVQSAEDTPSGGALASASGDNYALPEGHDPYAGGAKTKAARNLDAIRLLKALEGTDRLPSVEEQAVLAGYSGWGGIPQAFEPGHTVFGALGQELRSLLTDEEYAAARASTPNAHYTSPVVARAIHQLLGHLGVRSGRMLEPSMGTGIFVAATPPPVAPHLHWTGVELDSITGRISKLLYPKADIRVHGYERLVVPDGFFDGSIGNVPFGDYQVPDRRYAKLKFNIHDYFFAKTLDLVRPGGVVAFITSHFTLDKLDPRVRTYLADRADFLGAVRLPSSAFQGSAGTAVVTDIIVLQRRAPGAERGGVPWTKTVSIDTPDGPARVNEFFASDAGRGMVLGAHALTGSMYGANEYTVTAPRDADLAGGLRDAIAHFPPNVYRPAEITSPASRAAHPDEPAMLAEPGVKEGAFVVSPTGAIRQREQGVLVDAGVPKTQAEKVKALIGVRDAVREVLRTQLDDAPIAAIDAARTALNRLYDRFVKQHGPINAETRLATKRLDADGNPIVQTRLPNLAPFKDDPDWALVAALEHYDPEHGTATKADILTRRIIEPPKQPEHVDTPAEALPIVLGEAGSVDLPRVAQLAGVSEAEAAKALAGTIFEHPTTGAWQTASQYLAGNVRQKLREAQAAAAREPRFALNVHALEAAQPVDLQPSQISAQLGSPWIPTTDVQRFIDELLGVQGTRVHFVPFDATWKITPASGGMYSFAATNEWGTTRANAFGLLEDALNLRATEITDPMPGTDGARQKNPQETLAAQEKQQRIKDRFRAWVWDDPTRGARLAAYYNEHFNNLRVPTYDGAHLTLPGAATHVAGRPFQMRPHQVNAVWRILESGNTLLAHVVGAGKTYTIVAAAMEAKRMGLARKPLVTVPNHMLEQWTREFKQLYPTANLLIATKEDFARERRKAFVAKAAANDWDAILMTHRSFEAVPMSAAFQEEHIRRQLAEIDEAIRSAKAQRGADNRSLIKGIEKAKKRREAKLAKLKAEGKKDDLLSFEEMGVDQLYVDEAHLFKNLEFVTKMRGMSAPSSERAFDLYLKTQYLHGLNPGHGVVFATGTPISNSMAEMYTILRYLAPDLLRERGISAFDAWAATFGESVTSAELAPDGSGYRLSTRFARFKNLGELAQMFRSVSDVMSADDLNLPRPTLQGGKIAVVAAPALPSLKAYVRDLVRRAQAIKEKKVEPDEDNFLKVTTDGRHAAMDMRLVDADAEDAPRSKLNLAAQRIAQHWRETQAIKGVQLVFSDLSAPGSSPEKRGGVHGFNVYDEMRRKLLALGLPAKEVRSIHEADTPEKKTRLFADVRAGRVRVLLGSTEKMGAGTNVQDRLVALHHLDAPWRPSDIEQRNGRILRQGNVLFNDGKIPHVAIYAYVTEGSFDAYIWQTLERKAGFIEQAMKADAGTREIEDLGTVEVDFATAKAIASGNPKVKEKADVDIAVQKLQRLASAHTDEQFRVRKELATLPAAVAEQKIIADEAQRDAARVEPTAGDQFRVTIRGRGFTDRPAAGEALQAIVQKAWGDAAKAKPGDEAQVTLGTFGGFELAAVWRRPVIGSPEVWLKLSGETNEHREVDANDSPKALVAALEAMPKHFVASAAKRVQFYERDAKRLADLQAKGVQPFAQQSELTRLLARQAELTAELQADAERESKAAQAEATPPEAPPEQVAPAPARVEKAVPTPSLLAQYAKIKGRTVPDIVRELDDNFPGQRPMAVGGMYRELKQSGAYTHEEGGATAADMFDEYKRLSSQGGAPPFTALGVTDPFTAFVAMWRQASALRRQRLGLPPLPPARPLAAVSAEIGKLAGSIQQTFNAASVSPSAGVMSRIVRHRRGEMDHDLARVRQAIEDARAAMDKLAPGPLFDGPRWQAYREMEEGQVPNEPALRDLWRVLRKVQDDARDAVHALGPGHLDHFLDDYMARVYVPLTGAHARDAMARYGAKRPMEGRKGFKRQRQHVGLAESLEAALAKGLGPPTDNPIDMVLLKVAEMRKYVMAHRIFQEGKAQGLIKFKRATRPMPEGYTAIEDPIAVVKAAPDAEGAQRIRGQYVAPTDVARILNNFLSPGLRGKPWYNAYAWAGNVINMVQLGMSAFHAGFVAFDATVQVAVTGLDQILAGAGKTTTTTTTSGTGKNTTTARVTRRTPDVRLMARGAGNLALGLGSAAAGPLTVIPLPAAIRQYMAGRTFWRAYMADLPSQAMGEIVDGMVKGGGRMHMDQLYRAGNIQRFRAALRDHRWASVGLHAPFAAVEATMYPLLEHIVPHMKAGAVMQQLQVELAKLDGAATEDDVRRIGAQVVDAVDARLGQMIYDNRFWHKVTKDVLMAGIRSVGWNVGTLDVTVGAAAQGIGNVADLARGKRPDSWHKVEYLAMLAAIVAIYGAMYTYLHTGQVPGEGDNDLTKDLYYPRTGATDPTGNAERATPPTYMKDVFSLARHPLLTVEHKMHPLLSSIADILENRNFYGDKILDGTAPILTRVKEVAGYVAKDVLVPFSIRNAQEVAKRGEGTREKVEGALGMQAAPREVVRTPAQNRMSEILRDRGQPAETPEEVAASDERRGLTVDFRTGTIGKPDLRQAQEDGILSRIQRLRIQRLARELPTVTQFKQLSAEEALDVYRLGTPDEQSAWGHWLHVKLVHYKQEHPGQTLAPDVLAATRHMHIVHAPAP